MWGYVCVCWGVCLPLCVAITIAARLILLLPVGCAPQLLRWYGNNAVVIAAVAAGLAGLACFVLFLDRVPAGTKGDEEGEGLLAPDKAESTSTARLALVVADVRRAVEMLGRREMLLSMATFVYFGMSQTFVFGIYPVHVRTALDDESGIGFVMMYFGVAEVLGSLALGRLADAAGRRALLALTAALHAATLGAAVFGPWRTYGFFAAVAFVGGLADAGLNTAQYMVIQHYFPPADVSAAFGVARFFQAGVTGIVFLAGRDLGDALSGFAAVMGVLLVGAGATQAWLHRAALPPSPAAL